DWMRRIEAAGLERGQDSARSVDVVDAPAAPPGAVPVLLADEILEPACDRLAVARIRRERFERVRGDVLARRVDHVAEVAERELVEPVARVVGVESAPPAVRRLH